MDAATIRERLKRLRTYEDALNFFGDLGYSYAGDTPVYRENWPSSTHDLPIARLEYLARQQQDFYVIYCELQGERLLRTIQRPILDQIARTHPFFMVIFRNQPDNSANVVWEFVNVRVVQDIDEEKGTRRTRRIARRISIGPSERQRDRLFTASQRLALIDISHNIDIPALELQNLHDQAFDVEQVTKDFYNQYVKVFHSFEVDIERRNPTFAADAAKQAQLLLDRLMFLYFIQKKGWLNQEFSYLYDRFEDHRTYPDKTTYFDHVIKPLFLALAIEGHSTEEVGLVPFLNGGLFQFDLQDMVMSLKIGNGVFAQAFDSLFEVYAFTVEEDMPNDRSVAIDPEMLGKVFENLVLTREQEKDLRKSTGSYYTPRTIVSFMCQQSLREYLLQMWHENFTPQPVDDHLPIKTPGKSGQLEFRDIELDRQQEEYKNRLIQLIEEENTDQLSIDEARQIRRWLLDVRVVDPAVGSGAFLVGMLQEIIRLITLLDEYTGDHDPTNRNYAYNLKRDIIGHCLYGVDIQEQAVQICELRLWLSLVVDFEPETDHRPLAEWIREIAPLPNLSYLVRQGDSLIERVLGETVQLDAPGISNEVKPIIEDIQERKAVYFRATNADEKRRLDAEILAMQAALTRVLLRAKAHSVRVQLQKRFPTQLTGLEQGLSRRDQQEKQNLEAKIHHLQDLARRADEIRRKAEVLPTPGENVLAQLRHQLGGFIWRVDFGEVFAEREGFDIVIGNPPYLEARNPKFPDALKDALQEAIRQRWHQDAQYITRGADLLTYFLALGIGLIHDQGTVVLLTQNSWLDTEYGRKFQKFLLKHTVVKAVIDSDYNYFDSRHGPKINTIISIFKGKTPSMRHRVTFARFRTNFLDIPSLAIRAKSSLATSYTYSYSDKVLCNVKWGILLAAPTDFLELLDRLKTRGTPLADINLSIGQGLNLQKKHFVHESTVLELNVPSQSLIPFVTSADGAPFEINKTNYYLLDQDQLSQSQISRLTSVGFAPFNRKGTRKKAPILILPRGIGRHFCAINATLAFSASYVEIYSPSDISDLEEITLNLWLFLNSSIAWLIREISGRKNLGGGMLKAEAVDLKPFPLYLHFETTSQIREILNSLRSRQALDTLMELDTHEHRQIDEIVFDYLNIDTRHRRAIIDLLKDKIRERIRKSRSQTR